jgi:hypothetical protein
VPRTEEALILATQYRSYQIAAADATAKRLAMIWAATVDPENVDGTIPEFAAAGASNIVAGQHVAVESTDVFISDYLWLETSEAHLPVGQDPADWVGLADTDAPLPAVLAASAAYVRRALEQGRPVEEAMDYGLSRATRLARSEVLGAGRRSLADLAQRTGRFSGWRRQTSSKPCRFCAALADGRIHPWSKKVGTHPNCSCTAIPVVRSLPERYFPATRADLEVA